MSTDNGTYRELGTGRDDDVQVLGSRRPTHQALLCRGCEELVDVSVASVVINCDHGADYGLDCISVFCAPRCLFEYIKRLDAPAGLAQCARCEGAGYVQTHGLAEVDDCEELVRASLELVDSIEEFVVMYPFGRSREMVDAVKQAAEALALDQ